MQRVSADGTISGVMSRMDRLAVGRELGKLNVLSWQKRYEA